jgi:cbb3-type cytochrome oxidase subunit 3
MTILPVLQIIYFVLGSIYFIYEIQKKKNIEYRIIYKK